MWVCSLALCVGAARVQAQAAGASEPDTLVALPMHAAILDRSNEALSIYENLSGNGCRGA
jgi:hypothetical protein